MWGFWEITDPAAAPGVDVAALRSWPEQPLQVLDGMTPRQALQRQQAEAEVEMLIRHLEYDADTRQLERVDTSGLRAELGLPTADDQIGSWSAHV